MRRPNFYAGGLDRAGERRKDQAWLAEALTDARTRFLPLWQLRNLAREAEGGWRVAHLAQTEAGPLLAAGAEPIFLGLEDGIAHFALLIEGEAAPVEETRGIFRDLRAIGPLMPGGEAATAAHARGLAWWHARHRFCGVCGATTLSAEGGHVRRCTNAACATSHFPRTDPAVIMLVTDGPRCLLGRQAVWPAGMYSTLAGFVEPGESLEDAVAREVREETGIEVADVQYQSSQPWPFPSSVMLGFRARATTTTILRRDEELEDASWFDRDYLKNGAEADGIFRSRIDSIARRLIDDWLAEG